MDYAEIKIVCHVLGGVLQQPVPAALKLTAPNLARALPVLAELVDHIGALAERLQVLDEDLNGARDRDIILARALSRVEGAASVPRELWLSVRAMCNET